MKCAIAILALLGTSGCGPSAAPGTSVATTPSPVPISRSDESPAAPSTPAYEPIRPFSTRRAMADVRALAGRIGPRTAGSGAFRRSTMYVRRRLVALGYEASLESFPLPQGGRSANVVASTGSDGIDPVVIGAHLDTVPLAPGANDNASGTAVLLEVARSVAGTRFASRITFVAFGAEERQPDGSHHLGSEGFVAELTARERRRIRAMVSVDMIGKEAPLIVGWLGARGRSAVADVLRAARRVDVPAGARPVGDVSDHGPFALAGIPAALLWTGPEPNYHSPADVVSNVDPAALRNAGNLVLALIRGALRR